MGELLKIQNDLLFACQLICFLALMLCGLSIAVQLYQGKEVDEQVFNWLRGVAVVLGLSFMLGAFLT
jgi:hypothetical protein